MSTADFDGERFKWRFFKESNLWIGIYREYKTKRLLSDGFVRTITVKGKHETKLFGRWIGDESAISSGAMVSRYENYVGGHLLFEIQFPLE
jgi:hypothetical protein